MSIPKRDRVVPTGILFISGAVLLGVACTTWMPSDFFLTFLSFSIVVALILAIVVTVDLKNERRPSAPVAIMLEMFWLPSRNGEVKIGPALWIFLGVVCFAVGMLGAMLALPFIT